MSDTLRGYTVFGGTRGYTVFGRTDADDFVAVTCDRCGDQFTGGYNVPLADLVQAATEHSGRCLG